MPYFTKTETPRNSCRRKPEYLLQTLARFLTDCMSDRLIEDAYMYTSTYLHLVLISEARILIPATVLSRTPHAPFIHRIGTLIRTTSALRYKTAGDVVLQVLIKAFATALGILHVVL